MSAFDTTELSVVRSMADRLAELRDGRWPR